MANETEPKAISFGLKDFSAGAAVPDGKYRVTESFVHEWDYNKPEIGRKTISLHWGLTPVGGGDQVTQEYSIGDPAFFQPSGDGKQIVPVSTRSAISKGSNFYFMLTELVNAGFPEDKLAGATDFSMFVGLEGTIQNVPQPKRNLPKAAALDGGEEQERERTIPVFKNIDKLPWEHKKPTTGATPKAAGKPVNGAPAAPAAPEADQSDPETTAAEMLAEIVTEKKKMSNVRIALIQRLKGADPGFKNAVLDYVDTKTDAGLARVAAVAEMAGLNFDAKTGEISPT